MNPNYNVPCPDSKINTSVTDAEIDAAIQKHSDHSKEQFLMLPECVKNRAVDRLKRWCERKKERGLVDIKFHTGNISDSTVESFAQEVMEMLEAPTVPDSDHIGGQA